MPKRPLHTLVIACSLTLMVAGCGIIYRQPIYQGNLLEKSNVDQLQAGMSKQQVQGMLGTPSIQDPFRQDRWDYTATQRTDRLGHTEVKNLTVWFENDTVSRFEGEYFPEQDESISDASVRQFGRNLAPDKKKKRGGG